jgi:hypothetical protein
MSFIVLTLFLVLTTTCLIVPVMRANEVRRSAEYREALYLTKLRIVRRYYPSLARSTYTEIARNFDVDELYDNIGRGVMRRSLSLR